MEKYREDINTPDFSEIKELVYKMWKIARKNAFANLKISKKTQEELVTELDVELERMAREKITEIFYNVDFLWEEFWEQINKKSKYKFIIDPIDWTESYINKEFQSSISLAVEDINEEKIIFSAVYDFMKDVLYISENWKNEIFFMWEKINIPEIESDKIKILISWEKKEVDEIINNLTEKDTDNKLRISRQYGSIALQMSQVASEMYDIYIRPNKIKTWDIAAAINYTNSNTNLETSNCNWNKFDYKNPKNWLIIYKKEYSEFIKKIINN